MTTIQKTLFVKQGNNFIEYMNNVFFPSIQCPTETAERYCQAVRQYDSRAFKKYFQVKFIKNNQKYFAVFNNFFFICSLSFLKPKIKII